MAKEKINRKVNFQRTGESNNPMLNDPFSISMRGIFGRLQSAEKTAYA